MPVRAITLTGLQRMGAANPADLACAARGGTIEIRTGASGQYGVCVFPDGSECDSWALYRGECAPASSTVEKYPRLLNYGISMGVGALVGLMVAASQSKRGSMRALGAGVGAGLSALILAITWPRGTVATGA